MGLKTTNYTVANFGISLPTAYARLADVNIDINGNAFGKFEVHQTRDDMMMQRSPFDTFYVNYVIDKDQPIHKQIYQLAKKDIFPNWEDDIVEEETTLSTPEVMPEAE